MSTNPGTEKQKPVDKTKKNTSNRGFASMDPIQQRAIASKGGKASAAGDTSNRGFASMDPERQRLIAREGGKASHKKNNRNRIK